MKNIPAQRSAGTGPDLASLLVAIATGDRSALADLYRRTSAKLYGIAVRVVGDPAAAEEILQDVYLTVWNKAAMFQAGRASPITWMATITRNRAIDRKRRPTLPMTTVDAASAVADDVPLASEIAEQRQESGRLQDCLQSLDDRTRGLIVDAFLGGATYPELASRDDVPLGTMKSWVRRGLQRLRGCLES